MMCFLISNEDYRTKKYLDELVSLRNNGMIKVTIGTSRCDLICSSKYSLRISKETVFIRSFC